MARPSFVHSLAGRLFLFGVLPTLLVIAAIVSMSTLDGYRASYRAEERLLDLSADGAASELSLWNAHWNDVAATMAFAQADGLFGLRKASSDHAHSVAAAFPLTIGAYVIYEPDADGQDAAMLRGAEVPPEAMDPAGRFVPYWYVHSGTGGAARTLKLKPTTDMETLEYYLGPKDGFAKTGKAAPTLTEPYLYEGEMMVSHTYPIVRGGRFVGITGVDRSLDLLSRLAAGIQARVGADVFILSAGGRFIAATTDGVAGVAAPDRLRMRELAGSPYAALAERWRSVVAGGAVFAAADPVLGEPCIYATCPVETGGWTVVVRRTEGEAMRGARAARTRNVLVGALGLVAIGGLLWGLTRAASRRVQSAAEAADRIARGDLTQGLVETKSLDETGQLVRSMGVMDESLNGLVGSVNEATVRLGATASEIAATSREQESASATFGSAASQIAAAVKEISATGKALVRTMAAVTENVAETARAADAGSAGVAGIETVMRSLEQATTGIAERLASIDERSKRINAVITTITQVADRTNILSINAAIEAEKAGRSGAGFIVIAHEIRRLADETAAGTLDIEKIVGQMREAVSSGVAEMERFTGQVRRGVGEVASAGARLTDIIARVKRSGESFERVDEAIQAQAVGAQQISDAMGSLTGNAQQSSEAARAFAEASADLRSATLVLKEAVARFRLKE